MVPPATLVHQIEYWARERPFRPALHEKIGGRWRAITWKEYWQAVRELAKGLIALGLREDECVAIVGANYAQWVQLQFGIEAAKGIPAPIYVTNTIEQVAYILRNAEARFVVCDSDEQVRKMLEAEANGLAERFAHIVTFFDSEIEDGRLISFSSLRELGRGQGDEELERRLQNLEPEATNLLIYTSGTTGEPKGVMFNAASHLRVGRAMLKKFPAYGDPNEGGQGLDYRSISYLPLCHGAEQIAATVLPLVLGGEVYFCPAAEELKGMLAEVRPTIFFGVPRVWEKFEAALRARLSGTKGLKGQLASWALGTELRGFDREVAAGRSIRSRRRELARKLVIDKIKAALGLDALNAAATGAAPISEETLRFFASIGVCIHNVYGLTETSSVTTMTDPSMPAFGTVGTPLGGVDLRIAEDGEIQFRTPNNTRGYYRKPDESAELYTEDGWLRTGDIGTIDRRGNLLITGRIKELLVTAGAKNVAPIELENYMKTIDGVGEVVVVGDRKPYLCALVTLDPENLAKLAEDAGVRLGSLEAMARDPKVQSYVMAEVEQRCNRRVAPYQTIKKIVILDHLLSVDGGELTPTMKLRRAAIAEKYAARIEAFYETR